MSRGMTVLRELLARSGVSGEEVSHVVFGHAIATEGWPSAAGDAVTSSESLLE